MKLSLIVPVYNEDLLIGNFYTSVRNYKPLQNYNVEIVFVNDGSNDETRNICIGLARKDPLVKLISFSRNFGKEAALCAGLEYASADVMIPIDVDLQDPIEVIPEMVTKWEKGAEVVLAKRINRSSDSFLKRTTAALFYKFNNKISQVPIEENVGDFRLLDKKVVAEILKLSERNLFMKGLFAWVGFKTDIVEYTRKKRETGISKFNGWRLWNFALDGITSFSTVPLRLWTYVGALIAFLSFCFALYMVITKLFFGNPVAGYPSLIVVILFLGGVQLIGIGVLGEYIGRIYLETKARPRYIVAETINCEEKV